jgi:hypothetical protein
MTKVKREEIKKFLESNENESTKLSESVGHKKSHDKGKVPTLKKKKTSQINNIKMHLQLLEKQDQTKSQTIRQKEIIKIRTKINEIKTKQIIQRTNETKNCFFGKINKIDTPLANMTK